MLKAEQIPPDAMYAAWKALNAGMTLTEAIAAAINAWPGVETIGKANRATPAATLEQQILDPNHPKNDREWWAADEITRLRAENEKLRDALSGVLWMADEWFNHGGDETTFADDYEAKLEAARAVLSASQPAPSPMTDRAALRDKVARAIWETNSLNVFIAAAIDIVLEEAAKVAENETYGFPPEMLTEHGVGYERACKEIAAAIRIRAMIPKENTNAEG